MVGPSPGPFLIIKTNNNSIIGISVIKYIYKGEVHMNKLLEEIKVDFEKMKNDERYSQQAKNEKYASLMDAMERLYRISFLAGEEFDALDPDVKELYLEISNARVF